MVRLFCILRKIFLKFCYFRDVYSEGAFFEKTSFLKILVIPVKC